MSNVIISKEIERLLKFSKRNGLIEELDVIPCRNALMDLLKVSEPYEGEVLEEQHKVPGEILNNILDYAVEVGLIEENTTTYRDLLDAKIMGNLMPRQSEVAKNFLNTCRDKGVETATDEFYALSKASNYIMMDRIEKNIIWEASTDYGALEITINLSKPEKDPKEIAAAKLRPQSNYPKCLLCIENVGFAGHINHPARQNHRVIPLMLSGEQWYLQYSPYVYYNEHSIVFNEKHVPMKISENTFIRLLEFVDQIPNYFIGSNADLPIVGGSILSHDHFQGGRHTFPMAKAEMHTAFTHNEFEGVKIGLVKWPMSVIRISSKNKEKLISLSMHILEYWKGYSDELLDIFAYTSSENNKIPHNTITPIARKNNYDEFEIDLVLRNNRTSEEHPDGIYHPHKELHHIKKENIGLIEVMGLAVLPARLNVELKQIQDILQGNKEIYETARIESGNPLYKHMPWIDELIKKYGISCTEEQAKEYIKYEVGDKFLQVLMDAGVYKTNEKGIEGFYRFMQKCGFKKI